MAPRISIDADLRFELSPGGSAGTTSGTVKASGRHLEVFTDDPALLSGLAGSDDTARDLADALAAQHLSMTISGPKGPIATVGDVKAPLLHRVLTRSSHIRLGKVGALLTFVRTRRGADGRDVVGLPPGTPLPFAPTLQGWRRRRVTTTHDPLGGGRPRLVQHLSRPYMGEQAPEFALVPGITRIGSDETMDIVLPELEPEQAHVYRTERDEYVVRNVGRPGTLVVNGAPMTQQLLRTGTRVELGSYTFGYVRDEHADHGRPYGGRTGGETGRQRRQPPRPGADPVTDSS
ncbi:FHA domain-containing protein [Solicola sp. PLA-1-18]|uniref:FHA domain-containing protein n=1 Tax=Solicola sp. PLA-1-18 TaxID=3380532 RepID=UPI003B7C3CBF